MSQPSPPSGYNSDTQAQFYASVEVGYGPIRLSVKDGVSTVYVESGDRWIEVLREEQDGVVSTVTPMGIMNAIYSNQNAK